LYNYILHASIYVYPATLFCCRVLALCQWDA